MKTTILQGPLHPPKPMETPMAWHGTFTMVWWCFCYSFFQKINPNSGAFSYFVTASNPQKDQKGDRTSSPRPGPVPLVLRHDLRWPSSGSGRTSWSAGLEPPRISTPCWTQMARGQQSHPLKWIEPPQNRNSRTDAINQTVETTWITSRKIILSLGSTSVNQDGYSMKNPRQSRSMI